MKRPLIGALAGALAVAGLNVPAHAQAATTLHSEAAANRRISVPKDKSLSFRLAEPASRIVVAQGDIAQVVPTSDRTFYVRGKEIGSTNLLVYGPGGRIEVIDVVVTYDAAGMQDALAAAFPGEDIQVRNAGQGLLLVGEVSNTGVANRAAKIAGLYAKDFVTNNLTARASQEVILEVRVLEASRSVLRDIGVSAKIANNSFQFLTARGLIGSDTPSGVLNLTGASGSTILDAQLQALENKGLIHTLARPNLVAVSGEKASFLAGGEFPYPVPQSDNNGTKITIEFRQYGVRLDFAPLVQDNGLIRLEVAPEVSQLDPSNAVRLNGYTVPGLITRRTATTVELRDGASLAIGGLFQRNYQNTVNQVPGLGEIPILGALFRSARWQTNETELLIIVTPKIATPADFAAAKTADVRSAEPTAADIILKGDAFGRPAVPAPAAPSEAR